MKPEIAELWAKTLESGKYTQTTGKLNRLVDHDKTPAGLCCLGVLCELAIEAGVEMRVRDEALADSPNMAWRYYAENNNTLPAVVRIWSGMTSDDGGLHYDGETTTLAILNDKGTPFTEIAKIIRQKAPEL